MSGKCKTEMKWAREARGRGKGGKGRGKGGKGGGERGKGKKREKDDNRFSVFAMGNGGSSLTDLNLFSKSGVFTREQLDEYQVQFGIYYLFLKTKIHVSGLHFFY